MPLAKDFVFRDHKVAKDFASVLYAPTELYC